METIRVHESELSTRFLEGVRDLNAVRLYGIADTDRIAERTPTFAIRVGDEPPEETANRFAERGIYVWDGDYYALEVMERLDLQSTGVRDLARAALWLSPHLRHGGPMASRAAPT